MQSIRRASARIPLTTTRLSHHTTRSLHLPKTTLTSTSISLLSKRPQLQSHFSPSIRSYATHKTPDEYIEEITEQFATAKDEFEIAAEETDKKSIYAADDRTAAREELDRLKLLYEGAVRNGGGEEVQRRVGHRIRELEQAVEALEKKGLED